MQFQLLQLLLFRNWEFYFYAKRVPRFFADYSAIQKQSFELYDRNTLFAERPTSLVFTCCGHFSDMYIPFYLGIIQGLCSCGENGVLIFASYQSKFTKSALEMKRLCNRKFTEMQFSFILLTYYKSL